MAIDAAGIEHQRGIESFGFHEIGKSAQHERTRLETISWLALARLAR